MYTLPVSQTIAPPSPTKDIYIPILGTYGTSSRSKSYFATLLNKAVVLNLPSAAPL